MKDQTQNTAFEDMPLTPQMLRAIKDIGYANPTSIQALSIPLLIEGNDVIGRSCTGSGKTAAFAIPAIENIDCTSKHAQVLVVSPTRELAMQIYTEMKKFAKYKEGVSPAIVYGGAPMGDQIKQLRSANIVIGTPGRLMDHMRRKTLKLGNIQTVILDEADEMLNMGFIEDIETILTQVPEDRQTVLFSATMSAPLLKISKTFLTNPKTVDVMTGKDNQADIDQTYYQVAQAKKKEVLSLLMHANGQRSVIFCNTKMMVDELAEMLNKQGFSASGLHGDMTQGARSKVMQGFRNGSVHALIATDVAARGIDVDDVDVVINYDVPQNSEYYTHRIGRTGRAGKRGLSQTLVCSGKQYSAIRSYAKQTKSNIEERKLPNSNQIMEKAVERTALEVQQRTEKHTGKAAQKLVETLRETGGANASNEDVALMLAEMLMGGDDQFERFKNIEAFSQKPARKKSSDPRGARNNSQRKSKGRSQGNRNYEGKRNHEGNRKSQNKRSRKGLKISA